MKDTLAEEEDESGEGCLGPVNRHLTLPLYQENCGRVVFCLSQSLGRTCMPHMAQMGWDSRWILLSVSLGTGRPLAVQLH